MHPFQRLMPILATLSSLAAVSPSFAGVASVNIDWSQLQTQVLPITGLPAPTLTFSGQSTRLSAGANSAGDGSESLDHLLHNWTDTRTLTAHTTNGDGTASATSSTLSASASSTAAPVNECCGSGANGNVDRSAGFSLSGPGSLVFSVPYALSGTGPSFDFFNSTFASINGSINFPPTRAGFRKLINRSISTRSAPALSRKAER